MPTRPKVLLLGGYPEAHFLAEALYPCAFVTRVERIPEALALAAGGDYDVLFCECELAGGNWRIVLEKLQQRRQEIPVVVFCHSGGESEWADVLYAGAFDYLAPPYNRSQILALLEQAVSSRCKRKELRLSA